jgi:hypothetical protein
MAQENEHVERHHSIVLLLHYHSPRLNHLLRLHRYFIISLFNLVLFQREAKENLFN